MGGGGLLLPLARAVSMPALGASPAMESNRDAKSKVEARESPVLWPRIMNRDLM